jgi:pimeloyl-ACP methyl ester carboxylesterase
MRQMAVYQNGNSLSYAEYGDRNGFPILIQHGLIASISDSYFFERLIQAGRRLICMARPGYGESSPYVMHDIAEWGDIVAVLVDELKLAQFDVLGMSSGAPYSYSIGYRFPEKVRNIFILSGLPALYDEKILAFWPYPVNRNATMAELEKVANDLFFANLSTEDLAKNDIQDSRMNHCFGIALDLKLRCMDWGFRLADVSGHVHMRHSKSDDAVPFITAEMTSKLLPDCRFEARENDAHFSTGVLDDFIRTVMMGEEARGKRQDWRLEIGD